MALVSDMRKVDKRVLKAREGVAKSGKNLQKAAKKFWCGLVRNGAVYRGLVRAGCLLQKRCVRTGKDM